MPTAARIEHEGRVAGEGDAAVLELADADLRPLQVGEDADRTAGARRGVADGVGARDVFLGLAVGEVHAHDVHAGVRHAFQGAEVGRGGAEGGDDLGVAGHAMLRQGGC